MADKIVTLKNTDDDSLFPMTQHNCVSDSDGDTLPSDFTKIVRYDTNGTQTAEQTVLDNYYTKAETDTYFSKVTTIWTGTLRGNNSVNISMSAYKKLRIYCQSGGCNINVFELDLSKSPSGSNYTYNGSFLAPAYDDLRSGSSASYIGLYLFLCTVDSSKTTFTNYKVGYLNQSNEFVDRASSTEYYVYKIEGIE